MSDVNPYVAQLFQLANSIAVPLTQNLAAQPKTRSPDSINAAFAERLSNNSLNGSGPSDPRVADQSSPRTMLDNINGTVTMGSGDKVQSGASGNMNMSLIAAAAGLAILFFIKR